MPDTSDKPIQDNPAGDRHSQRAITMALIFANAAFWVWTFFFIADHTIKKSDGFEWVATVPFTFVFFFGVLLPFMRLLKGQDKGPGFSLRIALALVIAASIANVILYNQISGEFGPLPALAPR